MKQGQALNIFAVSAIVLTTAGGWYFREPLGQTLGKPLVEQALRSMQKGGSLPGGLTGMAEPSRDTAPAPVTATVYRWVDKNGITHYDQQGGAGREEVSLDSSKIQRLQDLTPTGQASARQ